MKAVAYYTDKYEYLVADFVKSAQAFGVPFYLRRIPDLGSWALNTHYKPTFIKECLELFEGDIVYVDIDARFHAYPKLFDSLDCDIAFHRLRGVEVLSGTIFLKNNQIVKNICEKWIEKCNIRQDVWEQTKLEGCLGDAKVLNLPIEYCAIFDHPLVKLDEAVIVHHQASRQHRRE